MRFVGLVLALVFGLAMVGPETHACPVHSATPAGHHQDAGHHESGAPSNAHCTCPQACCPSAINVSLTAPSNAWTAAAAPVLIVDVEFESILVLPARTRFLPFALAPPLTA